MTGRTMLRSRIFGVACIMVFANSIVFAETAQDTNTAPPATAAPSDAAPKSKAKQPEKKAQESGNAAKAANPKLKRGQYGTEAEAKARCRGEVVWVDKDNFNHYAGSREYGRKPGAFACENG